jgi:hypothetical protein
MAEGEPHEHCDDERRESDHVVEVEEALEVQVVG